MKLRKKYHFTDIVEINNKIAHLYTKYESKFITYDEYVKQANILTKEIYKISKEMEKEYRKNGKKQAF